jgi:hypothetical protein
MRRPQQPVSRRRTQQPDQRPLAPEVESRRCPPHDAVNGLEVLAAAEFAETLAEQDDRVTRRADAPREHAGGVLQQPDDAEDGRRVDGLAVGFVVEAHVAAGDRHVERTAGLGDALDRLHELPHDLGPFRVAEVQAVGGADRNRAGTRDVPGRLGHGELGAQPGTEVTVTAIAVDRQGKRARRPFYPHDPGAHAGGRDRVRPHHVVVLPVDPPLAGDGRGREQRHQHVPRRRRRAERRRIEHGHLGQVGGPARGPVVDRRLIDQRHVRDFGDDLPLVLDAHHVVIRDISDLSGVQVPLLEDALDVGLAPFLDDQEHSLLRFRQHDLVRSHAGLALRHVPHVDLDAAATPRPHLARGACQAGGAHVLHADEGIPLHQLEAGLQQELLHERIADLHRRALLGGSLVEFG